MTDINRWTREQFEAIPHRDWNEEIGRFDSLVVIPAEISPLGVVWLRIRRKVARLLKYPEPELWTVDGIHDSGYRCMDFVAVMDDEPVCLLSGCSDVIHIEGIGGFGARWLERYGTVPKSVPPVGWSIDVLLTSGFLRLFCDGAITCGAGLSSFEIYSAPKREKREQDLTDVPAGQE